MKVFISWSGATAKEMARLLKNHLQYLFDNIEIWFSDEAIGAGERGLNLIEEQLSETNVGIICITPSNQTAPWVNFEAGALSKNSKISRVMPVVFGMEYKDMVNGPLKSFQVSQMDEDGIQNVVLSIHSLIKSNRDRNMLIEMHHTFWPKTQELLDKIDLSEEASHQQPRPLEDKVDEILSNYSAERELVTDVLYRLLEKLDMPQSEKDSFHFLDFDEPPELSSSLLLSNVSLQARAFLKPAVIAIDPAHRKIILRYGSKHSFNAKHVTTRANEIQQVARDITGITFELVVLLDGLMIWPPYQAADDSEQANDEYELLQRKGNSL